LLGAIRTTGTGPDVAITVATNVGPAAKPEIATPHAS
jgi:hypothetical protein